MQTAFAPTTEPPPRRLHLGVFDSGVGGLSVLRDLRRELPHASLIYLADSGHAPYGERSDAFVAERSHRVAGWLAGQGIDALVIACNTATAVAAASLREAHPALSVVGVEPGLKPAVALAARLGSGHGAGGGAAAVLVSSARRSASGRQSSERPNRR